jgi:putative ATPase
MKQLGLFQQDKQQQGAPQAPLAERMRPQGLEEFVGQEHLLAPGKILSRILTSGQPHSLILWGPPGCGKTTLARLIAQHSGGHLISLSAVMAGTREIRAAVEEAQANWHRDRKRTWLLMDEIHRLNKAQQDSLLPHVERGTLLLLGATTENPSFEVIRPLLSRARVAVLEPLGEEELRTILERALKDKDRGLGKYATRLTAAGTGHLIAGSGGDARVLLNALETAVLTTVPDQGGSREIDVSAVEQALQRKAVHYDKGGEEHFNLISALHKSLRGSDPDAGLYWLARMLEAGEDPLYIARRLVRFASEDVGLADPSALLQTMAAQQAFHFLGSPEGDLALAQAVVYLALAPKSNTVYSAFGEARAVARETGAEGVPLHLRNAPTPLLEELGYGCRYQYPHDDPRGWIAENYLPERLLGRTFFRPSARGWEGSFREELERRREQVQRLFAGTPALPTAADGPPAESG